MRADPINRRRVGHGRARGSRAGGSRAGGSPKTAPHTDHPRNDFKEGFQSALRRRDRSGFVARRVRASRNRAERSGTFF